MIKRTLIVIAAIAFVASVASAALTPSPDYPGDLKVYFKDLGDSRAIKVDGSVKVYWPYEFKFLEICTIPVYMQIGMYIRVVDCDKNKKIVVKQVDCADLKGAHPDDGIGSGDFVCYEGCIADLKIVSNFDAVMGAEFHKLKDAEGNVINGGKVIDKVNANVTPPDVLGDGLEHKVTACVWMWKTKIEKFKAGDEQRVGDLGILAKPKV